MPYDRDKHHRRSIRLRGYDYGSAGAYFVTLCAHQRECLFGEIEDGKVVVSPCGRIVDEEWQRSSAIRPEIALDRYVVMPNHFHAIVWILHPPIEDHASRGGRPSAPTHAPDNPNGLPDSTRPFRLGPRPKSLATLMRGFKSSVTIRVNALRETPGAPVWQRNYHERVVRNDRELDAIREYIVLNPARWNQDEHFPGA